MILAEVATERFCGKLGSSAVECRTRNLVSLGSNELDPSVISKIGRKTHFSSDLCRHTENYSYLLHEHLLIPIES